MPKQIPTIFPDKIRLKKVIKKYIALPEILLNQYPINFLVLESLGKLAYDVT
jgi:hypothetical protein